MTTKYAILSTLSIISACRQAGKNRLNDMTFIIYRKALRCSALLYILLLNPGCASVTYYAQSIQGQLELMQKSRAVSELLEDESISADLRQQLNTALAIRAFSIEQLGLPDNKSYFSYADLGRDYVVWSIFATEEFSLTPMQSCFLFVGCLDYRGFFKKAAATAHAEQLKAAGMETYLGGVSAYSTLGWFDDPLLNTMLKWSEARLAAVIFHELAHQKFYIKDDTEFNESLADAIAIIGVRRWFAASGQAQKLAAYEARLTREAVFFELVLKYKARLEALYQKDMPSAAMRAGKKALYDRMRAEYADISRAWTRDYYGKWFGEKLNNAAMASVFSYRKYLSAFLKIYETQGRDMQKFYAAITRLAECDKAEREQILIRRPDRVQC